MSKYRFKNKEEFIRDGLWNDKYNCPDEWAWKGQMNKYLGIDVPEKFNMDCDEKKDFEHDGWLFQSTDYVLKEQQKYFNNLSQHIGRYIRALVDNPHQGSGVYKGDIGKIIDKDRVDFPNFKRYHCTCALDKDHLGIKYELLPEDYSPEQETKGSKIEFIPGKWYKYNGWYIKYKDHVDDVWRSSEQINYSKKYSKIESRFGDRDSDDKKILLIDLSEIQEYLPNGHPDKIINQKFEIGKWYKWYQKNHGKYHFGKVERINTETDTVVMLPWIIGCTDYNYSGYFDLSKAEQIQELSVEEVQEFLPKKHSDKISSDEFKKGEYIVITHKFDSRIKDFVSNHIYKQRKDSTYLQPEYDSLNSRSNGWIKYTRNNSHNWRYATQEEIDEYEKRGKPYDVVELNKQFLLEENVTEIPEYVECFIPYGKAIPGKVYKTTDENEANGLFGLSWKQVLVDFGRLEDGSFEISNKEAYENQKSHIPEYIECTETQESYFIKGNIYKVIDSSNLSSARLVSNIDLSDLKAGTSLFCSMEIHDKKYWKPSTKEVYEQQKNCLGSSEEPTLDPYEGTITNLFVYDEVKQYLSTSSDYWKEIPKFTEQDFDIYGPTPDIE